MHKQYGKRETTQTRNSYRKDQTNQIAYIFLKTVAVSTEPRVDTTTHLTIMAVTIAGVVSKMDGIDSSIKILGVLPKYTMSQPYHQDQCNRDTSLLLTVP